jgi:hypothetical protein
MDREVMWFVCHAAGMIVSVALAVYFLREGLYKRLRASLWWALGFLLVAFSMSVMTITTVYGVHKILVMLAFSFFAASVASLYYAGSLLFFDRKSFFREKCAVMILVASFVLFVLPVYLLPESTTVNIIESPAIILCVVAILVIAVLFSLVARLPRGHCDRKLVALQSLAWWIAATCIATKEVTLWLKKTRKK